MISSAASGARPERRLVGDEHRGRVHQRRREAQHLLLTARQQPGLLLAAAAPRIGKISYACARVLLRAQEHLEVLLHAQPREDAARLGREHHAGARPLVRRQRRHVAPVERDGAAGRREQAGGDAHRASTSRRRSRRAARPPCPWREVQRDAVQHLDVAVPGDDVVERERGVRRWAPPGRRARTRRRPPRARRCIGSPSSAPSGRIRSTPARARPRGRRSRPARPAPGAPSSAAARGAGCRPARTARRGSSPG